MSINKYELMLDKETKRSELKLVKSYEYEDLNYNEPKTIHKMMTDVFDLDLYGEEYIYLLAMNSKMKLLGIFEIAHGGFRESLIDPKSIFIRACYIGAENIVLVHNHPSGDPTPSSEDIRITKRIDECGKFLNMKLTDHIIVGEINYESFREKDLL